MEKSIKNVWERDFLFSVAFIKFIELIPEAVIFRNTKGDVVLTNTKAQALFHYSKDEFKACSIEDLVPETIKGVHASLREDFFLRPSPRFLEGRDLDLFAVRKDGSQFPIESALFAIQTEEGPLAVNMLRDVTAQRESQEAIESYAFIDALTDLPNRRYFMENFKRNMAKAERHGQSLGLLFVDLDKFKPINDSAGHDVGDAVLRAIGGRLSGALRKEDFLARIGGDEFVVMVYPLETPAELSAVAKRVLEVCREVIEVSGQVYQTPASIGFSYSEKGEPKVEELLRQADKAMYAAKEQGGDCFVDYKNLNSVEGKDGV